MMLKDNTTFYFGYRCFHLQEKSQWFSLITNSVVGYTLGSNLAKPRGSFYQKFAVLRKNYHEAKKKLVLLLIIKNVISFLKLHQSHKNKNSAYCKSNSNNILVPIRSAFPHSIFTNKLTICL